jgi:hypothetical protein
VVLHRRSEAIKAIKPLEEHPGEKPLILALEMISGYHIKHSASKANKQD